MTTDLIRQKFTTDFIRSYSIQKQMARVSGFNEKASMDVNGTVDFGLQNPFSAELAPGQIRLLPQFERPTYILLMRRWEEDSFLTMAFSHYDFPATDQEFKPVADNGMYLNTLQAWNTRTLQDETLKKSWCVGTLPKSDCQDAWLMWKSVINDVELPENLLRRTALPVVNDDDVRCDYMEEELALFAQIDALDLGEDSRDAIPVCIHGATSLPSILGEDSRDAIPDWDRVVMPALWNDGEVALAAGEPAKDRYVECEISGRDETAVIQYSVAEKTLAVSIFEPNGKYAVSLDEAELIDEFQKTLGKIHDGNCTIHPVEYFDGKIALRDRDGQIHVFMPEKEF